MNKGFLNQIPSDEQPIAKKLRSTAEDIQVLSSFQAKLESQLRETHNEKVKPTRGWQTKILPSLGWAILIICSMFLLNWAVRSLMPGIQPASGGTRTPETAPTKPSATGVPTHTPVGEAYERYGNPLYLAVALPDIPVEANLYTLRPEEPASIASASALAMRFGIDGDVYVAPSEIPGTNNFMVTDGRQRMYVRSEQYFTYYRDYENYSSSMFSYSEPLQDQASTYIDEFLKSHGFDFPYQVENAPQIVNDFYIIPLSPDGFPLRFDYLMPVRLEVKLDSEGQVIFAQAYLIDIQLAGSYGIISAEEAFQQILAQNVQIGLQEGVRSGGTLKEQFWQRSYPENEIITIYGRASSFPSVETGKPPFISIGDHTATGNTAGLENAGSEIVEASGQFQVENEIRTFFVESWSISNAMETSIMGTLRKDGENAILTSFDDNTEYLIENAPTDVPVGIQAPEEQFNVSGVLDNGQLVWSSIQYFPAGSGYGGGGGGGSGFHKLNLTGTPVPFPTPSPVEVATSGTGEYTVQEGDTLSQIAYDHGVTIEELMQANGLAEATIFIGQTLVIPGAGEGEPKKVEGLRGILSITIYNKPDGSQRVEYGFINNTGPYYFLRLEGEDLQALQAYQNRPVDVWGTVELQNGTPSLKVERYEIPFPDLQFQILRGKQEAVSIEEQPATLFATMDGQTYVQLSPDGLVDGSNMGSVNSEVLLEVLIIPGETFGGYPALRVFNASMAINPKNGLPQEMRVSADQPYIIDEAQNPEEYVVPIPTIEKVELIYYTNDLRYAVITPGSKPTYIQPVWRFYGHYSNGDEFEILVQALKAEFLLPEIESIGPPG
jgi:LysM repeat protein